MQGIKHLIACHCILPQFRDKKVPTYHKFVAFSVIDESDTVVASNAQCNNCGTVHKIYDICKSEIIAGKDESLTVEKRSDISISLPTSIVELFENYQLEIPDYQYARFVLENKQWNSTLMLTSESADETKEGKLLRFISEDQFRVEPFSRQETI